MKNQRGFAITGSIIMALVASVFLSAAAVDTANPGAAQVQQASSK